MQDQTYLDADSLKKIHRHFINVMCNDESPMGILQKKGAVYNFSAFVVSVDDRWIAVTAGHIFDELKMAIASGSSLRYWRIDDSILGVEEESYPISLDIDRDVIWVCDEIPGIDYACFEINWLTKTALEKNGICAIDPEIWDSCDLDKFPIWLLVGTPFEKVDATAANHITKDHVTLQVVPSYETPPGFDDKEYARIYAEIRFDSIKGGGNSFNIKGMSGGPIFAIAISEDSISDQYRIVGVQSAWNQRKHIAICSARPFLKSIENSLRRMNT